MNRPLFGSKITHGSPTVALAPCAPQKPLAPLRSCSKSLAPALVKITIFEFTIVTSDCGPAAMIGSHGTHPVLGMASKLLMRSNGAICARAVSSRLRQMEAQIRLTRETKLRNHWAGLLAAGER